MPGLLQGFGAAATLRRQCGTASLPPPGVTATSLWEITRRGLIWYYATLSPENIVYGSFATQLPFRARISGRNPCSKNDDTHVYEKGYRKIVGSATDMSRRLLYRSVEGFPGANSKGLP